MAVKMGRPRIIKTHQELFDKIQDYFNTITVDEPALDREDNPILMNNGEPLIHTTWLEVPMVISLCLFIGIDHETLQEYEKRGPDFSDTITRARQVILSRKLQMLDTVKNPRGVMFDLSVNHGLVEQRAQNIEHSGKIEMPVIHIGK